MAAQDHIINFNGIVKNRLGPYKIVLKNQDEYYLSPNSKPKPKLNQDLIMPNLKRCVSFMIEEYGQADNKDFK